MAITVESPVESSVAPLVSVVESFLGAELRQVDDDVQTMTVEMAIGLAWVEPRLLFNNIFDWEERRSVKTNEKLIEHLWAPNLHFLSTEKLEKISTLKNSGSVTIYRNGTVQFDSHVRITVGRTGDWRVLMEQR